jgi:polyhydroxybutyrate depolymerase
MLRSYQSHWTKTAVFAGLVLYFAGLAIAADSLARQEWRIGNATREALLYIPAAAKDAPCPLVFVFHGHGGTMRNAANTFAIEKQWPETIVVYMQGLNTPGALTDPEGKKPGWQRQAGDQDDRDLKFFDAVLTTLKRDCRVDEKRIYVTGHSNGGAFTYLLWATRGNLFAAVAPSGAFARGQTLADLRPKPVLHIAGEKDNLVRFEWQQLMMDQLRKLNGCGEGKASEKWCTLYPGKSGNPVVTCIYPGGHQFPKEAVPIIVKFFKEHAGP